MNALEAVKKEIETNVAGAKVIITRCDVTLRGDNAALIAKAEVCRPPRAKRALTEARV